MRKLTICLIAIFLLAACSEKESVDTPPSITFQTGSYTQDGEAVPLGGKLTFGITANGGSEPLTNIRIQRVAGGNVITEVDKGLFVKNVDYPYVVNAVKSDASEEVWRFMAMNSKRDSVVITRTVLLGEGVAYGPIRHFPSVKIGMQNNTEYPHFLCLSTGTTYSNEEVAGNEASIDLLAFVYQTSGIWSPTLNCPQYTTAPSYYPIVGSWTTRNSTLYDYNAVDNNLVSLDEFNAATNDSLLVASFKPQSSSGNCKFCFTGKIVPFKTQQGKYGLIRIIHADQVAEGYMELEIKIQE
ncbi:MAG: hypothetical protein ABFC55_10720 [Tenuifilaceae bacterium]